MASTKNTKPAWLKMSEADLKKIIAELAEKNEPAKIGLILRDQYGIPSTRLYGKKLSHYLKDLGLESNTELRNAQRKMEGIKEHLKENVTDRKAKHRLQKAQSRYNILKKYFAKRNKE